MTAISGVRHIGATAYFGLLDVGHPKAGETLVVRAPPRSGSSWADGKVVGCRVSALRRAGEVPLAHRDTGFDAAIDYKREPCGRGCACCAPGIDVYFDNVGGDILDAALSIINLRARSSSAG